MYFTLSPSLISQITASNTFHSKIYHFLVLNLSFLPSFTFLNFSRVRTAPLTVSSQRSLWVSGLLYTKQNFHSQNSEFSSNSIYEVSIMSLFLFNRVSYISLNSYSSSEDTLVKRDFFEGDQ